MFNFKFASLDNSWQKNFNVASICRNIRYDKYLNPDLAPYLADAMEEAGCANKSLLKRLRNRSACLCDGKSVWWNFNNVAPELDWVVCPLCVNNKEGRYQAVPEVIKQVLKVEYFDPKEFGFSKKGKVNLMPSDKQFGYIFNVS